MNICSNEHDEVCYEGHTCPACELRDNLNSEIEDLKAQIKDLNAEVKELEEYRP